MVRTLPKDHARSARNQGESVEDVRRFIQQKEYRFRVVLDHEGTLGTEYGVQAIPTLVLINRKGVVEWIRVGYSDNEKELHQLIRRMTER
jgi:hypothetical protein